MADLIYLGNRKVICGLCGADITGPPEPAESDIVTCARATCGNEAAYSEALNEAKEASEDRSTRLLQAEIAKKNIPRTKEFSFTMTTPAERQFKFVLANEA